MTKRRWSAPDAARREAMPESDADATQLRARLEVLGLRPIADLRLTRNRAVVVSFSRRRVLSVHRGYLRAPDQVLKAIVRFVAAGTPQSVRHGARREILAYHAEAGLKSEAAARAPRRPDEPRPEDAPVVSRLEAQFAEHNARYFGGALATIPIRLSTRMRSRLGHLSLGRDGHPTAITISRRHVTSHGWDEVAHTLLHEMVHLWQHASGHRVDHGPMFRAKAREVGAHAAARRWIQRAPRRGRRAPVTS